MATIKSGNVTTTTNKDGSSTRTITNPGGSSITTTYNRDGTMASQTTNPSGKSSGNNGNRYTPTYYYDGGSGSGGGSTAAQPASTQVTYIDANGNRQTGYIIGGTTYTDAAGTTPVGVGSRVTGGDGQEWIKTATGSQLYADYLKNNGITETTIRNTDTGQPGTGYIGPDGYTYTDALLTQLVPVGTLVNTANGAYIKTETGSIPYAEYQAQQQDLYRQQMYQRLLQQPQQQAQQSSSASMTMLQSWLEQVNAALEQSIAYNDTTYTARLEQMKAQLQSQIDALNRQYQAVNRQLYVDMMNSRKNLPQALAAQGYTGGLTESSMLGLDTAYANQLSENERARLAGISDLEAGNASDALELQIAQAQANQQAYSDAYNNRAAVYAQMLQQQNLEDERAREDAQNLYTQALQMAQLGANYGDYSGLNSLGITPNTDNLYAQALASSGKTVAESPAKPELTAAQVNAAIKAGTLTQNVLDAYEYYYGEPYSGNYSMMAYGNGTGIASGSGASQDYDGLFAAAKASGNPNSFISNNYKKYGFTSSSGLTTDYKAWLENQTGGTGSATNTVQLAADTIGAFSYTDVPENAIAALVKAGVSAMELDNAVTAAYQQGKISYASAQKIANTASKYGLLF